MIPSNESYTRDVKDHIFHGAVRANVHCDASLGEEDAGVGDAGVVDALFGEGKGVVPVLLSW